MQALGRLLMFRMKIGALTSPPSHVPHLKPGPVHKQDQYSVWSLTTISSMNLASVLKFQTLKAQFKTQG